MTMQFDIRAGKADRTRLAVWAAGIFNWLLVAALLAAILVFAGEARAQAVPVCTGSDMVAEIRDEDPDLYAAIAAEAAETENGDNLLWRIAPRQAGASRPSCSARCTSPTRASSTYRAPCARPSRRPTRW